MKMVSILLLAAVVAGSTIISDVNGGQVFDTYDGQTPLLNSLPYHMLSPVSLGDKTIRDKRQSGPIVMNQPIRITTFFSDDVDANLQPTKSAIVRDEIIPKLLGFLQDTLSVSPTAGPILLNNDCTTSFFLRDPDTGNMKCADRCAQTTFCGPFQVPTEHLKACTQCNTNASRITLTDCVAGTPAQDGPGVSNTDFLLYITADQAACLPSFGSAQTVAFATSCQTEVTQDRPVAGVINFCPLGLENRDTDFAFALTKHEILHALAFARALFPLWRNPSDNTPRTMRNQNSGLPSSGISSTSTIDTVTYDNWQTAGGLVPHNVSRLVTPAVVAEARNHFNCSSLMGVELENQGGEGTILNHWEKRLLGNEGLTGQITFNPVFSRFTFAALEDSGWYSVNYSLADDLIWGRDAGCRFAEGSCGEWISTQENRGRSLSPFCNVNEDVMPLVLSCTVDREAVSRCNRITNNPPTTDYQYFSDALSDGGRVTIADYCPFQDVFQINRGNGEVMGTTCSNENDLPPSNELLEVYGEGSRCVNHGNQWAINGVDVSVLGGGCYQYNCSENEVTITIATQSLVCRCSQAGTEMMVDVTVSGLRYEGSIICPPCIQICHSSTKTVISANPVTGATTNEATALSHVSHLLLILMILLSLF